MSELIERRAAIDALAEHEKSRGHNYTLFVDIVSECAEIIRDLPSAQPEQNAGQWIPNKHTDTVLCSQCGKCYGNEYNYCPNCGADMRGTDETNG